MNKKTVEDLIEEYLLADESDQPIIIERMIADYPEFKQELLEFEADHHRLKGVVRGAQQPQYSEPDDPNFLRIIGPYRLLQKIGGGGMGEVWMARNETPEAVFPLVALKLIKAGIETKNIVARFDAERQALSMMDHPHIAKFLDSGTTNDNQPYFAMELVYGKPITTYCDDEKLSVADRLRLFILVCEAVQHAHQKGIIHRDLKPSNILVGYSEGKAVPKVIDFGLAKALQHLPNLTDKTLFTEFGRVVGTLQYMSPEQAELNAPDVDTRADVYSLGVLLYQLLTGTTPLEIMTDGKENLLKLLRSIHENDPPKPSERLSSSSSEGIARISQKRQIDPRKLSRILRGELDWIVMKSLEKDRRRRYETVLGLGEDVERFINFEPVKARPPSTAYRVKKFFRKNRKWAISLTAAFVFIVTTAAIAGYYSQRMERLQVEAGEARVEAENRKAASQQAYWESGLRALATGNLPEAEKQFTEGINLGDAPLSFHIKLLRSTLTKRTRDQSQHNAKSLLNSAYNKKDKAELLLILGDLKACESKTRTEFRADLNAALELGSLSEADHFYANALLANQIGECQRYLEKALNSERFHYRAASLYTAVLLAAGKMNEAGNQAKFYLIVFPSDTALQAVAESCSALVDSKVQVRSFTTSFDKKLTALRLGFIPPSDKAMFDPKEQFAFARMGGVAFNAASFLRELPKVTDSPGLPLAVFDARATYWREVGSLAAKLGAPNSPFDLLNIAINDRENLIKQIKVLSENESDGLALQVLASAKFVTLAMNYEKWKNSAPELATAARLEIDEAQSQCLDRETLAPRGPFELASRLVRFIVNIQLAKFNETQLEKANAKIQQDVDRLHELLLSYPQMLPTACSLILGSYAAAEPFGPETQLDIANQLTTASLWVTQFPQDGKAWFARAKLWEKIRRSENAVEDLKKCLEIDPMNDDARKLLESLESSIADQ